MLFTSREDAIPSRPSPNRFLVSAVDDLAADGAQRVTVAALSPWFASRSAILSVLDDEARA